jgi:hypothetical protein
MSTEQQYFVLSRRFCLTEISRLFTLRPQVRGIVIRRAAGPIIPAIPQRRLTQPAGVKRSIEGLPLSIADAPGGYRDAPGKRITFFDVSKFPTN